MRTRTRLLVAGATAAAALAVGVPVALADGGPGTPRPRPRAAPTRWRTTWPRTPTSPRSEDPPGLPADQRKAARQQWAAAHPDLAAGLRSARQEKRADGAARLDVAADQLAAHPDVKALLDAVRAAPAGQRARARRPTSPRTPACAPSCATCGRRSARRADRRDQVMIGTVRAADPTGPDVLVVDDDEDIRTSLERGLTLSGFSVRTVPDGESALRESATGRPTSWSSTSGSPGRTASGWSPGCGRGALHARCACSAPAPRSTTGSRGSPRAPTTTW